MSFHKLLNWTFVLFGLFPILPSKIKGLPVIILFFLAIYKFVFLGVKEISKKELIILTSLFLINVLSVINTEIIQFHKLETILALLIIPVSYIFLKEEVKKTAVTLFSGVFVVSSFLLSIIHFIYFYKTGLFEEENIKVNSIRKAVINIPYFNDHPIYVSMFLAVAILLTIWIYRNTQLKYKVVFLIFSIFSLLDILLISSKGVVISLLISIVLYSIIILNKYHPKWKYFVVFIIFSSFVLSIFYFPTLERRFRELRTISTYKKIDVNNSTSIRVAVYKCVIETIKKKPVFGYGLGAEPQLECYKKKSNHLYKIAYNSHNQYLGYMLNSGIIGLLVFLYFLYYNYAIARKKGNFDFIILLSFFSILFLTENIIERQSGVILFIFIICFFNLKKQL